MGRLGSWFYLVSEDEKVQIPFGEIRDREVRTASGEAWVVSPFGLIRGAEVVSHTLFHLRGRLRTAEQTASTVAKLENRNPNMTIRAAVLYRTVL